MISMVCCIGFFAHIYYIPFYFQASKSLSAEAAGIRFLPYLISNCLTSLVVGMVTTKTGIFIPFAWIGTGLFAVGSALMFTLKVDSNAGQWVGYQILTGGAYGILVPIPLLAIQNTLPEKDLAVGSALFFFAQSLGGSIGVSVAQNIFANALDRKLKDIAGVDIAAVHRAGAAGIRGAVPEKLLGAVILAYNYALTRAYVLPIAAGCAGFVFSLCLEWRRIGAKKVDSVTENEKV
jgi:hypothetical protein